MHSSGALIATQQQKAHHIIFNTTKQYSISSLQSNLQSHTIHNIMSNNQVQRQICPDGHRCDNGSMCTENPYDEGGYYCDCDEGKLDTATYAGLYCEHEATSYCTFEQEVSTISFCTNNGECKVEVSPDETHLGCDCKIGYEGEHCQFVDGAKPNGWPFDGSAQPQLPGGGRQSGEAGDAGRLQGGVIAVIVLIVFAFIGAVGFLVYRKKKSMATPMMVEKNVIPSSDLVLESADGSVLKESMRMSDTGTNSDSVVVMDENEGAMEDIKLSGSTDQPDDTSPSEII
jgi:hypothetical protein